MIAIGGSIGAGFFIGLGGALSTGGPASLLIDKFGPATLWLIALIIATLFSIPFLGGLLRDFHNYGLIDPPPPIGFLAYGWELLDRRTKFILLKQPYFMGCIALWGTLGLSIYEIGWFPLVIALVVIGPSLVLTGCFGMYKEAERKRIERLASVPLPPITPTRPAIPTLRARRLASIAAREAEQHE
ncbi:hypothetical protein ACEPPN_012918 [Leptodophora sp. 'Broadleaf-Isolate-01']